MAGNSIIGKYVLSVNFEKEVQAPFSIQQEASRWCHEVLLPAIDKALAHYSQETNIIRLDSICIDLQTTDTPFSPVLAHQIATEIMQQVEEARAAPGQMVQEITPEQSFEEAFVFFLNHGYLPWWCNNQGNGAFMQKVNQLASTISDSGRRLLQQQLSNKMMAQRLVMILQDGAFIKLLAAILKGDVVMDQFFLEQVQSIANLIPDNDQRNQFLLHMKTGYVVGLVTGSKDENVEAVLALMEYGKNETNLSEKENGAVQSMIHSLMETYNIPIGNLQHFLAEAFAFPPPNSSYVFFNRERKNMEAAQPLPAIPDNAGKWRRQQEGFYVADAGLILAAPFLPRFFTNLGIVADGRFNSQDLAVALLQWLVTGAEQYFEFDTVLAKVFCGMEPEASIRIINHLPEGFKKEAVSLLEAMIGHWPVLKNTSVEGIRQAFLQREGKLSLQGNEWLLQVDQKAYDMLLNELPWTIHTVKLPWMDRLVRTEWV